MKICSLLSRHRYAEQRVRKVVIFDRLTAMATRGRMAALIGIIVVSALAYYAIANRQPPVKQVDLPRAPILVAGIDEPEELRVEPTPLPVLTPAEQAFANELRKPTPPNAKRDVVALINPILKSFPEYGDGYAMRMQSLCYVNATKAESIVSDINFAIKYHAKQEGVSPVELLRVHATITAHR